MNAKTAIKQLKALESHGSEMRLAAEEWANNFQTLISIILSARTRDEVTIEICKNLFKKFPTPNKLSQAKIKEVERLIRSVNFYRNKSKNILNCSKVLAKEHKSKVPEDIEELISLPGVGRKTANVFLTEIGGFGIGVDTHVNYCSRYLSWTLAKETQPKKIEEDLKKLFPKKYWNKVNSTLVRFGKTHLSKKKKNAILDKIKEIK